MSSPSAQAPSPLRVAAAHALLVVACAAVLYPVLWVLKMALTPSQAFSMDPSPFPSTVSLQNFRDVIGTVDGYGEALFWRQLGNSVIVALVTSALGVGLSCTAAYAMSRMRFFGREARMQASSSPRCSRAW
jgi:arabinogalactan oligomer/maltooligosaccharide transport system permease protein